MSASSTPQNVYRYTRPTASPRGHTGTVERMSTVVGDITRSYHLASHHILNVEMVESNV